MYRYPSVDGKELRCAVGCLIPDQHYTNSIEFSTVSDEGVQKVLEASGIPTDHITIDMLMRLQDLHDDVDPDQWEEELNDTKYWNRWL
jgi:hypothetical protein